MKKIISICIVAVLLFQGAVFAEDIVRINDQNIKQFIQVFPEYKREMEHYGEDIDVDSMDEATAAKMFKEKVDSIFSKYGLTLQEFSILSTRIGVAYSAVQMEKQGMNPQQLGMGQFADLQESEMAAIRNNISGLEKAFSE
jgi:hypothetical protein